MINNLEIKIPLTIRQINFGSQGIPYNFRFFDTFPFRTLNLVEEGVDNVIFTAVNSDNDEEMLFKETIELSSSLSASLTGDIPLTLNREHLKRGTADLSIELNTLSGSVVISKYKQTFPRLITIS
jgi:hypothetical protein